METPNKRSSYDNRGSEKVSPQEFQVVFQYKKDYRLEICYKYL